MAIDYVNLRYKPKETDLVTEYYMEPGSGQSYESAASNCALESSIGTWTTISTMNPSIAKKLKPSVYYINEKKKIIRIAYTQELFEPGNMPGILSSIAGNIFGMKAVKNLKLMDIGFPKKIVKSFLGPEFGIDGIRKMTGVKDRPLVGTIVKPKVGLNEKQHAKVAYDAWSGGLDAVKDDENLVSMSFNNFDKRIYETFKLRDKAEKETGEKKLYFANITSEADEMKRRADVVKRHGGEYIMVDILTAGFSALQAIRKYAKKLKLAIHAHRAMHGALTRNPKHGISMLTIAKCARLIGVDTLHIGTAAVGKMHGSAEEEVPIEEEIESSEISARPMCNLLQQNWHHIKPVLAVASGGLSPLSIPKLIKIMGNDIVCQAGGGVHGNPGGTRAGAAAMRQAIDATLKGISLKEYAKSHRELRWAIEKWG